MTRALTLTAYILGCCALVAWMIVKHYAGIR
jgi:hypothetical protein